MQLLDVYRMGLSYTSSDIVRTNIEIDDKLLEAAMHILGQTTKRGAVEAALQRVVRLDRQQKALEELWGIGWEGDLDKMRGGE